MSRKPQQERAKRRRASLLDAAAAVLDTDGYGAVTTNSIAKEARAAVGTVYEYFPDKEALLAALLSRYRERLQVSVMASLGQASDSTDGLVERTVRAFARFYQREPGYAELWLGSQLVAPLQDAGEAWGRDFGVLISALVQQRTGVSVARAERVALTLVHAVSSVITLSLARPECERDALTDEAVFLAKAYLAGVAAGCEDSV